MELISLMYVSRSLIDPEGPEMDAIAAASQRNNARCGLSGFLYYDNEAFVQVLEGPRAEAERIYATIEADERHDKVSLLVKNRIDQRAFGGWTMGLYDGELDGGLLRQRFGPALFDRARQMDVPEVMRFLRDLSVGRDDVYTLPSMAS
jgi:hypothetical protein